MESLWVVVPAFNEERAIGTVLRDLARRGYRTIVVDDASSDGTAAVARAEGAWVATHPINLGQGAAIATGIALALGAGATHVCTFDADGQHDPDTIAAMGEALARARADVALGSRFLGADPAGMPAAKRATLRAATAFTRLHAGLAITDTHNGLRLFTRDAAARIEIRQARMAHASEILSEIARNGLRFVEVPTSVRYTDYSKAKGQSIFDSVKIVFDLAYSSFAR